MFTLCWNNQNLNIYQVKKSKFLCKTYTSYTPDSLTFNPWLSSLQTANGNVEAKVVCLFRRRDISGNLNTLADSNASEYEPERSRWATAGCL